MAQINLLPWREERRAERKKEFLTGCNPLFVTRLRLIRKL